LSLLQAAPEARIPEPEAVLAEQQVSIRLPFVPVQAEQAAPAMRLAARLLEWINPAVSEELALAILRIAAGTAQVQFAGAEQ
jgi:hypothetical protein